MKSLILKYFTDSLNDIEMEQLIDLLEKPENLKKFQVYLKDNYNLNIVHDDINEEAALLKVKSAIKNQEKPVWRFYRRYAAAAVLIGVLASSYFFKEHFFSSPQDITPIIITNNIKVGTDKATLTLEDGSEIVLEKEKEYVSNQVISKDGKLVYNSSSKSKPEIAYNYLTIPRGGQYHVKLSDGTEVWLNSESQLKYPVNFPEGSTREVELVYGEAYFDVNSSTNHNEAIFKVLTRSQEIEVLGTEFNVSSYKDENSIYTTLVEGRVAITNENSNINLIPNYQAIVKNDSDNIEVVRADVFVVTSWKNGIFSFDRLTLGEIMKVLSRWYDVKVIFVDNDVKSELFTGVLRKNQKIEDILNLIQTTNNIAYEIKNKTILFK